jgi:hypothetical protein
MSAFLLCLASSVSIATTAAPARQLAPFEPAPAAQIETPPSATKTALIKRFLRAIGRQHDLDSGSFLERYAIPGGAMWNIKAAPLPAKDVLGGFERRMSALKKAYEKHRSTYQQAYEGHVNWEFAEEELAKIVEFLESPVGKHYLDGRWRMDAYTNTELEDIEAQIVAEAQSTVAN